MRPSIPFREIPQEAAFGLIGKFAAMDNNVEEGSMYYIGNLIGALIRVKTGTLTILINNCHAAYVGLLLPCPSPSSTLVCPVPTSNSVQLSRLYGIALRWGCKCFHNYNYNWNTFRLHSPCLQGNFLPSQTRDEDCTINHTNDQDFSKQTH